MPTKPHEPISKSLLTNLYRQMLLIRRFEDESYHQYMLGNVRGFLHSYSGEEAIAAGTMSTIGPQDYVVSHYRDHGHALARGMDPKVVMAELFGKSTGCSGGRGGSMHLFDTSLKFMGGYAIVGGQMPIAVGLALAAQLESKDSLTICFLGDGALNEGEFHESMNLASVWKLPILFFCENNLYGMGASAEHSLAAHENIYKMSEVYNIPGSRVDGMDIVDVRMGTNKAVQHIRSGLGPVFLEAPTYRFRGHSISDPAKYRPQEEVDRWLAKDPLKTVYETLIREHGAAADELTECLDSVKLEIEAAVKFAEESPYPDHSTLHEHIYSD